MHLEVHEAEKRFSYNGSAHHLFELSIHLDDLLSNLGGSLRCEAILATTTNYGEQASCMLPKRMAASSHPRGCYVF